MAYTNDIYHTFKLFTTREFVNSENTYPKWKNGTIMAIIGCGQWRSWGWRGLFVDVGQGGGVIKWILCGCFFGIM